MLYSDSYWHQLSYFPEGWAANGCVVEATLSGSGGICEDVIIPIYLYPDGTWGGCIWYVDPTSPSGWSIDYTQCPDDAEGF